jgi:hypothetical protein
MKTKWEVEVQLDHSSSRHKTIVSSRVDPRYGLDAEEERKKKLILPGIENFAGHYAKSALMRS